MLSLDFLLPLGHQLIHTPLIPKNTMKKLLFLFVLLPFLASSQTWIPTGSIWHYDYWNIGEVGFNKIEYTGDTLIGGHSCQIIVDTQFVFYQIPNGTAILSSKNKFPTNYTYNNSDSVFYYRDNNFWLLYNFAANVGDSWLLSDDTTGGCAETYITVTGIGNKTINGSNKRWIDIETNIGGKYYFKGKAIEGMGLFDNSTSLHINSMFPQEVSCDSNIVVEYNNYTFKCFSIDTNLIYNPSGEDCEYLLIHQGFENIVANSINIKVYPNPTNDIITFSLNKTTNHNTEILIYNPIGKLIIKGRIDKNKTSKSINIQNLHNGLYFYKVENSSNSVSGKFIKR